MKWLGLQAGGAHEDLQQAHSGQEGAPAEAPERKQHILESDEALEEPSPSPESPEQPQQIRPGVQVLLASVMSLCSLGRQDLYLDVKSFGTLDCAGVSCSQASLRLAQD